ncbi:hypothetical protein KEM48_000327 [Puccinia striiformis f. sp. tritici PST-130]|nr:hypothetical protein KEM48_000327 [Puccinia striiformis f. sp. tritici PST-130]
MAGKRYKEDQQAAPAISASRRRTMAGPFLQARPNLGPLEQSVVRAEGAGLHNGGETIIPLSVAAPLRDSFKLLAGRTYQLEGDIEKLDNGVTTVLSVRRNKRNHQISEAELVDLGPVTIGGIGSIAKATLRFSDVGRSPLWDLTVIHGSIVSKHVNKTG